MKRKTIISSILVIVLCLGLISGSTFALFTSESKVNIAVTSGKVKLVASLDTLKVYSANPNLTDGTLVDKIDPSDNTGTLEGTFAGTYYYDEKTVVNNTGIFANGGKAVISDDDQTLTLTNVTPGDKVSVNVNIENSSNVKIKYRIRVNVLENDNEETVSSLDLFNGLVTKIDGTVLNGVIRVNNWTYVEANTDIDDVPVEIYLPLDAGNEYQEKTTQIRIIVEAVQNNAATKTELETINAYLAAQSTKNPTMYDAILDVQAALNLSTYAEAFAKVQDFLWNVDTDRFYVASDEDGFEYKYFKAYTYSEFSSLSAQTYSVYAYDDGTTSWTNQNVNVVVGFDAGVTTNIANVSFVRNGAYGKDFVIRTNSAATTLTVNAPKDTVRHYGVIGTVNIIAVAGSSYHENGKVAFVEITNGRLALEKDSQVSRVHFASTVVEQGQPTEDKIFNEIIVSYDSSLDNNLPKFSRDDVDIPTQGKLVVELQKVDNTQPEPETTSDFIWLTKQGIFEQIKVSGEGDKISEDAKWADDNEVGDDTQKAAQQIANNIGRDGNGNINVEVTVTETSTSETKTYEVALNENRDLVVIESGSTSTETPVATISKSGNITVGSQEYNIALTNNNENTTELVVSTTGDNPEVVTKVDTVKASGLSETEKEEVKTEVIEEVATEQLSDDAYAAKIVGKSVGYETIQSAINAAADGDVIKLLNDTTETISINGKTLTLNLNEKALTHGAKDYAVTVYDTNGVTIKNGTINGQIRIGERTNAIIKWKHLNYGDDNYEAVYGYHPLAPAKNILLKDLTVDSGNEPSLFYTNIEEDLVRGAPSNYCDNDLYGKYIYKTGYTNKDQYINNLKGEVFTVCNDKDSVTVDGGSYTGSSFVGNMVTYAGEQIEGVLTVREGTRITNAAAGRYLESGTVLVGSNSNTFVTSKTTPTEYTARINDVYYTYAGGANDAIKFANIGETVYINENSDAAKEIAQGESFTVISLQEGLSWTGATVTRKVENPSNYEIVETVDELNPLKKVYTIAFSVIARVYHVGDTRQTPKSTTAYDEYGSLKAAVEAAGTGDYVMLMKDTTISDESVISSTYVNYGIDLSGRMVLDLNGHTYTYTGNGTAIICTATSGTDSGQRAIRDTSAEKTGTVYATKGYAFAKYNQNSEKTVIYGGNFVSGTTNAVWIKAANVFEIQGGRFISLNNKTPINGTPTSTSDGVVTIQTTVSSEQYLTVNSDGTYEVNSLTKIDDDNYSLVIPVDKMSLLPDKTKVGYIYNWELADDSHKVNSGFVLNSSENEIVYQTSYTELTEFKISLTTSNANVTVKVNGEDWDGISNVNYGDTINVSVEYTETNSQKCSIKDQNGTTYKVATDFEMPRANLTIDASSSPPPPPSCLVQGTLVTLQNGTKVPVEQVKAGDVLLVLDHETGNISSSRVLFNDSEPKDNYLVLNLYFSNGSTVKIVDEHGFFDLDLMKYVYITDENYSNYIGHQFYGVDGNVTLVSAYLTEEVVELYSPVTEVTLNYFVEGLLSMPGGIEGMFNIFDYDSELKFDKQNDIDTYGLLDYEYFEDMIPYDIYVVFNGKYLNIAMQKGILTEQKLSQYIERYSVYWTE